MSLTGHFGRFWTIVKWFNARATESAQPPTNLTSWANKKVSDNDARAQLHVVRPYNKL